VDSLAVLNRLADLVVGGLPSAEAVRQIVAEYGLAETQAWAALRELRAKVLPERYSWPRRSRAESIARAERHYARCLSTGQLGTALQTLQWLTELLDEGEDAAEAAAPCRVVRRVTA
jgi:hypothetical protein